MSYLKMNSKKLIFCILLYSSSVYSGYIQFDLSLPKEALAIVAPYLPKNPVIVEAGAYNGNDTLEIYKFFPQATIYSFEPIPYLYNQLVQKVLHYPNNIFTFQLALSDTAGQAKMIVSEEPDAPGIPSMSSSLLAPKDHLLYSSTLFKGEITVDTITLDAWAEKNGIEKIDFIWLDIQGYELNVLKASPKILATVTAILTEVEFSEIYKDQYLFKDIKDFLESNGFTMIAKDFHDKSWFGDALFVRL